MTNVRTWKKVFEQDLEYLSSELKEIVERPAVIILSGDVGAGKTTFAQYFVKDLDVQSPTYSVINEVGNMAHADFYRLKGPEEIIHLELPLYMENKEFFLIEWGLPFLKEIARSLDDNFSLYELEIEIPPEKNSNVRNFALKKLDKI